MRVALTGATGFVGQHLVQALQRDGAGSVVAVVRSSTSAAQLPAGVDQVIHDIAMPRHDLFAALGRPDILVHLAWGGLPNYHSLHHFEAELPRHYGFLKSLVQSGLAQIMVAGTCYEYGMRNGMMQEVDVPQPANAYALAKDALRRELACLRQTLPFGLLWPRLFYMYGAGQAPTSLYAQLMAAGRSGLKRFAMSPGDQLRDFLPVGEVATQLCALALHHHDAGIVNVASGRPVSVRHLAEALMREHGFDLALDLGKYPYPVHEPMAFWACTQKLEQLAAARAAEAAHGG